MKQYLKRWFIPLSITWTVETKPYDTIMERTCKVRRIYLFGWVIFKEEDEIKTQIQKVHHY